MKMKKSLLGLLMALGLVACGEKAEAPKKNEKPVVKIGVILPLTGNSADVGEMAKKAILLAQDEIPELSKYEYKFIIEDDQFKSAVTANVINKLVFQDKVNSVLTYYAPAGFIVQPIAEQHKIPHFSNTWEENITNGDYNFIQYTTMEAMADLAIDYLQEKNIDKVAIITEVRGTSEKFASKLNDKMKKNGFDTAYETFNRGERDFKLMIEKLKSQKYDYFMVNSIRPEFDIIVKQLNEAGVSNEKIMGAGGDTIKDMSLYEGIVFSGSSIGTKSFQKKFNKKYGHDAGYGAVISYDLANLVVSAFENIHKEEGIPSSEEIIEYLNNLAPYDCGAGRCKISPTGYIINDPILRKVINGKYEVIRDRSQTNR
ncbi:MAG: ABC transporter substrate-binding protein [Alphaproteobacteria bacterium]|nr:ABC transporter substrate-binding protein [Alphaproteobacteria bacterium]